MITENVKPTRKMVVSVGFRTTIVDCVGVEDNDDDDGGCRNRGILAVLPILSSRSLCYSKMIFATPDFMVVVPNLFLENSHFENRKLRSIY